MLTGSPLPGEQFYLHYIKRIIRESDLDSVVLQATRYLSNDEIGLFFGAADITVIPYARRVGPSGVLSFALAYEVPSIITYDDKYVTRKADLPALPVNLDADEIASAILKLMTDKNAYAEQIQRIREYKAANNNEKIALLHIKLYEKLCTDGITRTISDNSARNSEGLW